MKSYRHLYEQVYDWDNLYLAYRKARKGKRGRPPAATFEFDLEANLVTLQQELREKRYEPGAYSSFYIHEPKRRLISAAPFRDRVIHHALCNVIEPIFERSFIFDSYANRAGKGTHAALDRAQQFARRYRCLLRPSPLEAAQGHPLPTEAAHEHAGLPRRQDANEQGLGIRIGLDQSCPLRRHLEAAQGDIA